MERNFSIRDIRNREVFPDNSYRFARVIEKEDRVILERDFFGENPLHYYIEIKSGELIVGNNIMDIKRTLEREGRHFGWERVRAVSNNTRATIDETAFLSTSPTEEELGKTLQEFELDRKFDYSDITVVGNFVRRELKKSVEYRLASVDEDRVGLLLSGGLDSMCVGYFLAQTEREVTAFTLKVEDEDKDVVKSREIANEFGLDLVEVKVEDLDLEMTITNALAISGNPKKDNLLCAVAMYIIGEVIERYGIKTVFCGEGPNEMINDYGFNPREHGYGTEDKGDTRFREALTFGLKKTDRQLGRGGLAKHATARMGKVFARHKLRLESPFFDKEIARVLTRVPHIGGYDSVKQLIVKAMFEGEGLDRFIEGTSKEKFQDGSGVSRLFGDYDQQRLVNMFERIYRVNKDVYLDKT